jgi:hypothetical protein
VYHLHVGFWYLHSFLCSIHFYVSAMTRAAERWRAIVAEWITQPFWP